MTPLSSQSKNAVWNSPVPELRWRGFRSVHQSVDAFLSVANFEAAQVSELQESLSLPERQTLHRLLTRGQKAELEVFIRTHGANPLFDPESVIDLSVGMVRADHVKIEEPASAEANQAILRGDVVHVFFQAGEASRFNQGPFYNFNPILFSRGVDDQPELKPLLDRIDSTAKSLSAPVAQFLLDKTLGVKQPVFLRAALRRVVQSEINAGRLSVAAAPTVYAAAIQNQKLLFFVSRQGNVAAQHDQALRSDHAFFGFNPKNIVTIEQDLIHGVRIREDGDAELLNEDFAQDAAGHLYALLQATRLGDFTTYSEQGRPLKSGEVEALGYLSSCGGKILNIIRINDMDRHTTEIINSKALTYALKQFQKGYANVVECVSNPSGQKGGTGLTFGTLEAHFLTETHENSFPSLSRAVDAAMHNYRGKYEGQHPAYNAMRQWGDLQATRQVLRKCGGRLVFVPRQKIVKGETLSYLGIDMPMGDLTLLEHFYLSRMFQFSNAAGKELQIHDMKIQPHLNLALQTILQQLCDPHIINATQELVSQQVIAFSSSLVESQPYSSPAPELF